MGGTLSLLQFFLGTVILFIVGGIFAKNIQKEIS